MNAYLPEGMNLRRSGFTMAQLQAAHAEGQILQAVAVLCTQSKDLLVDLGCCMGRIPREQTAIGADKDEVRDIAILSRVGKAVSFVITQIPDQGPLLLSRSEAQEKAQQHLFETKRPGDIIPAVITSLAPFGAFCDVGCGLTALMGIEAICISRIEHSKERFREDQQIYAVIRDMEPETGRIQLSHRELLGTWAENAAMFQPGQTVVGIVRSIQEYGAFIELAPNLSGLAEPNCDLRVSDCVSVYIKSILPDRLKIKLVALRRLDPKTQPPKDLHYFITDGHLDHWCYGSETFKKAVTVF